MAGKTYAQTIATLRKALGGDDLIHLGNPVAESKLIAVEKSLGVTLPDDYRSFIREYGWLEAGPFSELRFFGVVTTRKPPGFPTDLRKIVKQWRSNLDELGSTMRAKKQLAPLRDVIPFCCAEIDFPWSDTAVFDQQGRIRMAHPNPSHILGRRPLLDKPDRRSIAQFLHDVAKTTFRSR